MAVQLSTVVRNARLDTIETTIGVSAVLKIRTGAQPANCAAADSGTVLATLNLPSDYMSAAASGSKAMTGTWQDASADAAGTAAHWRLYASDGTTCLAAGSVDIAAGLNGQLGTMVLVSAGSSAVDGALTQTLGALTLVAFDEAPPPGSPLYRNRARGRSRHFRQWQT